MPNHLSYFDIPVLFAALPVQFRWLAKAELFKIPIFGRSMRVCEYISIDRSNRRAAFESLRHAADLIRGGVSVLIFPEGTRGSRREIGDFKKGGFVLAIDAGVPIIPIVIQGTWHILPRNRFRIKPGKVKLEIFGPIETEPYTRKQKEILMDQIKGVMLENFETGQTGEG
jgi:1-acyl-sn-glycerol-3-phosphate acyltransferase